MTTALLKAVPLSLLLLLPSGATARPGDEPRHEKEIVVDGDRVFALNDDDDEGPFVFHMGHPARGARLGVHLIDITPDLRAHFGAPRDAGVLVAEVEPDSPAAKAGVQVGDVITKIDGERTESSGDVSHAVRRKKGGETVKIEVERNRASKTLSATVEERKVKETELGDQTRRFRRREWNPRDFAFDFKRPLLGHSEEFGKLREKLDQLDKRLHDLEKKVR
jgi:membrane-associated protease RseP (regulator of RpoE activity)